MAYPSFTSRRMPYDIDGTAVGYSRTRNSPGPYVLGPATWLTPTNITDLNSEKTTATISTGSDSGTIYSCFWMFFPEKREIEGFRLGFIDYSGGTITSIQGSNDTANGIDGTWETAVISPEVYTDVVQPGPIPPTWWREAMGTVSFSEPKKVLRFYVRSDRWSSIVAFHVYGRKLTTETPDDLLFVDASTGDELTGVTDWGDRPEGTTAFKQVKVKNASTTKTANNINLQLNHSDFVMSWNAGGPWQATLDITSLGAGAESATIYLKNELGPPLLTLTPKAARIIATIGSWT